MSELFKAIREQGRHISSLHNGYGTSDAIQSLDELVDMVESELTAEIESRKKAEERASELLVSSQDKSRIIMEWKQRAESAEQRIREAQGHCDLYAAEMSEAKKAGFYSAQELYSAYQTAQRENAELTRKLAEQQAVLESVHWLCFGVDWNIGTHAKYYRKRTEKVLKTYFDGKHGEELTKLLEEAKRQAVPEWQPIETAPKDGVEVLIFEGTTGTICGAKPKHNGMGWYRNYFWLNPSHWMPLPAAPQPEGVNK